MSDQLLKRQNEAIVSDIKNNALSSERRLHKMLFNLESLPDFSDHCTEKYLNLLEMLHEYKNSGPAPKKQENQISPIPAFRCWEKPNPQLSLEFPLSLNTFEGNKRLL